MRVNEILNELAELGFPMLADWIEDGEIDNIGKALKHLEENKHMIDDERDVKAFQKAEYIVRSVFNKN